MNKIKDIVAMVICVTFIVLGGSVLIKQFNKPSPNIQYEIDNNTELFIQTMGKDGGTSLVYGELRAIDSVSCEEVDGEYLYLVKVKEKYTRHTKEQTITNGRLLYNIDIPYYSWDVVFTEQWQSNRVLFCNVEFDYCKFNVQPQYIKTIYDKEDNTIRYKYYGCKAYAIGTVYTNLSDNTMLDNSYFYQDKTIQETKRFFINQSDCPIIIFWMVWVVALGSIITIIYSLEYIRKDKYDKCIRNNRRRKH